MRVRATVLLIRHHAVLLVRERGGPWFLPGGEVGHGELPMGAAIRELHEETGAEASAAAFLWQQASAHHMHHVFRVAIPAEALPRANYRAGIDESALGGRIAAREHAGHARHARDPEPRGGRQQRGALELAGCRRGAGSVGGILRAGIVRACATIGICARRKSPRRGEFRGVQITSTRDPRPESHA